MGFLDILGLGKTAGEAVTEPIKAIGNVFDELFTSGEEKAAANAVMEKLKQHPLELQVGLNKMESQHRSIFVAGWRPYIGWILGTSLALFYIPQFSLASVLWVKVCWTAKELQSYPIEDISGLTELIMGMLGLAGLRTVEKAKKLTK